MRRRYKAEKMEQFKKLPLADPLARDHDGYYSKDMTRFELLRVRKVLLADMILHTHENTTTEALHVVG